MKNDKFDSLENLISSNDHKINSNKPHSNFFDNLNSKRPKKEPDSLQGLEYVAEYTRMRTLAAEDDDFKKVVNIFGSVVKRSEGKSTRMATNVLREAYRIYTTTQEQLAKVFGNEGQFDLAEEHLKNAHFGAEIQIGYFNTVKLQPTITEEGAQELIDNAIKNTPPQYFMERAVTASEHGNVKDTKKYTSLSLKSLAQNGVIELPDSEKMRQGKQYSTPELRRFIQLQKKFSALTKGAYKVAVRKKVEEAVGLAVNKSYFAPKAKVEKLREETKGLILDYIDTFKVQTPDPEFSRAEGAIRFFNESVDPMYEVLLDCCDDPNHVLRSIYRTATENNLPFGNIIGFKRTTAETTAVVPRSFYKEVFKDGVVVDPFFEPVVEMYLGNTN